MTREELKKMRKEHPEYFLPWGGIFSINNDQIDELRAKYPQTHQKLANQIAVSGSTGNLYIVEEVSDGKWTCTCKGFKNHRHCYHLDNLRREGKIK